MYTASYKYSTLTSLLGLSSVLISKAGLQGEYLTFQRNLKTKNGEWATYISGFWSLPPNSPTIDPKVHSAAPRKSFKGELKDMIKYNLQVIWLTETFFFTNVKVTKTVHNLMVQRVMLWNLDYCFNCLLKQRPVMLMVTVTAILVGVTLHCRVISTLNALQVRWNQTSIHMIWVQCFLLSVSWHAQRN